MTAELAMPVLLPLGDTAWTVEFGSVIDSLLHARVLGLHEAVVAACGRDPRLAAVRDLVPTFRSLTVHYDPLTGDGDAVAAALQELAAAAGAHQVHGRSWCLPACFDEEFAPDLPRLAERAGISREEVVARLLASEFGVYLIGFMPGFPYMGGVPAELQTPRLASPRQTVPARSIAVAGEMCAVYPWTSPGGWNLVGRTPLALFDTGEPAPSLLAAGDRVRWLEVDRQRFNELEQAQQAGRLRRKDFLVEAS